MVLDGFGRVWEGLGGFGRVWEGWGGVGMAVCDPTTPKPRQIVRCLGMLTHGVSSVPVVACAILLQPSSGDPLGLDRLDQSGIP